MKPEIIPIALALLTMLSSCSDHKSASKMKMPPPEIQVVKSIEEVVPNRMEFVSQTNAMRSYIIQPRISGYLTGIKFSSGMPVRRGQVLFTIDKAPFQTEVAQQRANLASAKASLTEAESSYRRSVPLAKINAISQSQMDTATANLESAREAVKAAQASLDNALLNLGYTVITAPESGIIAESAANTGDYVGPGTQYQVLTTISYNDSIAVNLSLPTNKYYKIVSKNSPSFNNDSLLTDITLTLSDGATYPYKGVYKYTKQNVNSQSGSIVLQVAFPNPSGLMKAGQFARVMANIGESQRRVLVPQRCVDEIQGVYNLFVVAADSTVEFRKIAVGDTYGSMWIIDSGLSPGEEVLTEGFSKVHSGMKIKPTTQSTKPTTITH